MSYMATDEEKLINELERLQLEGDDNILHNFLSSNQVTEFHRLLNDSDVTNREVVEFIDNHPHCCSMEYKHGKIIDKHIKQVRDLQKEWPIEFTKREPADVVMALSTPLYAITKIIGLYPQLRRPQKLIIATSQGYRPHAAITKFSSERYAILMSPNLVTDTGQIANIYCDVLTYLDGVSTRDAFKKSFFKSAFDKTFHKDILPYVLASIALGEKYRFSGLFKHASTHPALFSSFRDLMLSFFIAHELSHLFEDHFESNLSGDWTLQVYKHFYSTFSNIYKDAGIPDELVEAYFDRYGLKHSREFSADSWAIEVTRLVGKEFYDDDFIGLAASMVALSLLAWMDRATYYVQNHIDPLSINGIEIHNKVPSSLDIYLPRESHPWGKSRLNLSNTFYTQRFTQEEYNRLNLYEFGDLINEIVFPFYDGAANALYVLDFANNFPGETRSQVEIRDVTGLRLKHTYLCAGEDDPFTSGEYYTDIEDLQGITRLFKQ